MNRRSGRASSERRNPGEDQKLVAQGVNKSEEEAGYLSSTKIVEDGDLAVEVPLERHRIKTEESDSACFHT